MNIPGCGNGRVEPGEACEPRFVGDPCCVNCQVPIDSYQMADSFRSTLSTPAMTQMLALTKTTAMAPEFALDNISASPTTTARPSLATLPWESVNPIPSQMEPNVVPIFKVLKLKKQMLTVNRSTRTEGSLQFQMQSWSVRQ